MQTAIKIKFIKLLWLPKKTVKASQCSPSKYPILISTLFQTKAPKTEYSKNLAYAIPLMPAGKDMYVRDIGNNRNIKTEKLPYFLNFLSDFSILLFTALFLESFSIKGLPNLPAKKHPEHPIAAPKTDTLIHFDKLIEPL